MCEVVPKGEAARGGVRVGDLLVAVDSALVTDYDHALALFAASCAAACAPPARVSVWWVLTRAWRGN